MEDNSAQDKEQEEVMKDKIPCVMELKVLRNSASMEVGMVVTQVQEELQYQLDKEFQNIQVSEGLVSHAVDEWNVPEKDNVEPDSAKYKSDVDPDSSEEKNAVEPETGGEKDNIEFENGRKDDVKP